MGQKNSGFRSKAQFQSDLAALRPAIWRFALSLGGKVDQADDLTQATCLRALEKSAQFVAGTSLRNWCFTICRSIWLNELRSKAIRNAGGLDADHIEDLPDNKPGVETNIFAAEVFNRVMDMPEAIRMTVVLVYVEGFSYREAAEHLDIPIGTVMSRLASARKTLAPLNQSAPLAQPKDVK